MIIVALGLALLGGLAGLAGLWLFGVTGLSLAWQVGISVAMLILGTFGMFVGHSGEGLRHEKLAEAWSKSRASNVGGYSVNYEASKYYGNWDQEAYIGLPIAIAGIVMLPFMQTPLWLQCSAKFIIALLPLAYLILKVLQRREFPFPVTTITVLGIAFAWIVHRYLFTSLDPSLAALSSWGASFIFVYILVGINALSAHTDKKPSKAQIRQAEKNEAEAKERFERRLADLAAALGPAEFQRIATGVQNSSNPYRGIRGLLSQFIAAEPGSNDEEGALYRLRNWRSDKDLK